MATKPMTDLSDREFFAALIFAAIVQRGIVGDPGPDAKTAVQWADTLISALREDLK
jgi:hypothetical protein